MGEKEVLTMTNEEFQRLVLEKLGSLEEKVVGLEDKVVGLEGKVVSLEEGQKQIIKKLDGVIEQTVGLMEFRYETKENFAKTQEYIHELDTKNSERHLEFTKEMEELKTSMNRVELNTAENWRDIVKLKAVR